MTMLVIDPGHGGAEKIGGSSPNNAVAPNGLTEKDVLLDIALCIRDQFSDTHQLKLTRDSDVNLSLRDRASVAKTSGAAVMVSLHFNGFNGAAQGTETFVHPSRSADSDRLASCLQNSVRCVTGLRDRGVKKKNLGALRPSYHDRSTAAVLLEISFMDVAAEAERLRTAGYRKRLATAVMEAVVLYLSDPNAWGDTRYSPQNLPLRMRLSGFIRGLLSSDGLEH